MRNFLLLFHRSKEAPLPSQRSQDNLQISLVKKDKILHEFEIPGKRQVGSGGSQALQTFFFL